MVTGGRRGDQQHLILRAINGGRQVSEAVARPDEHRPRCSRTGIFDLLHCCAPHRSVARPREKLQIPAKVARRQHWRADRDGVSGWLDKRLPLRPVTRLQRRCHRTLLSPGDVVSPWSGHSTSATS